MVFVKNQVRDGAEERLHRAALAADFVGGELLLRDVLERAHMHRTLPVLRHEYHDFNVDQAAVATAKAAFKVLGFR